MSGSWIEVPTHNILINPRFGRSDGQFTLDGDPLPDWGTVRILVTSEGFPTSRDRVLKIEWEGVVYEHQNKAGVNIHGGVQTTSEWFTFNVGQFKGLPFPCKLVTVRKPLPAPCFGPTVRVTTQDLKQVPVKELRAGSKILTTSGWRTVLWVGGDFVEITDKNAPYEVHGAVLSPQHRVLNSDQHGRFWMTARQMHKAGISGVTTARELGFQWYGSILLSGHFEILINGGALIAESLLPTGRALSGMGESSAREIERLIEGKVYKLGLPEVKHKEFLRGRSVPSFQVIEGGSGDPEPQDRFEEGWLKAVEQADKVCPHHYATEIAEGDWGPESITMSKHISTRIRALRPPENV